MAAQPGWLHGKVAIVTGGASGIGAAMSERFAARGAIVTVTDVNRPAGEGVVRGIVDGGGEAAFAETNVAESESVAALVDAVVSRHGRLDIMANNAGIGSQSSGDEAGWWRLMSINVLGVAWGMREAVRAMRLAEGGTIVNTGSQAALRSARHGVYGSSKAAVHALTRYAALAHAPDGIRVNAVLPGNIYTPIHDLRRHQALVALMDGDSRAFAVDPLAEGADPVEARDDLIEAFRQIHPLGRLTTARDVADAATYLASSEAKAVTGNEFLASGGVMADLLAGRLHAAAWRDRPPAPPPPTSGTVALLGADPEMNDALQQRFDHCGLAVAVAPVSARNDERSAAAWLGDQHDLAGLVVTMRPDPGGDLFSQDKQEWVDELRVNLRVPWTLIQAASALLPAGAGVGIVTDAAGQLGVGSPAYCASSAALGYATEDLADALRPSGVRVNTIVAECLGSPGNRSLGAPAGPGDIAELVVDVMRSTNLTGLRLELITSHPDDRPNL